MSRRQVVFGDWQTPIDLARTAVRVAAGVMRAPPATVVEPTCGVGAFLLASREQFPTAVLRGYEVNPAHVAKAREDLRGGARVELTDFFEVDWRRELAGLPDPLLLVGNPPWVTNAGLGVLDADNLPQKNNYKSLRGLDALTGKSNFDVSEWMLAHLLDALQGRDATLAMLCKTAVARRLIEHASQRRRAMSVHGLWTIDAMAHFGAAVDACLFVFTTQGAATGALRAPLYDRLDAPTPTRTMGVADGVLVADLDAWQRARHLQGVCEPQWRSGLKHDCADVMELTPQGEGWVNGRGEPVRIERDRCLPMLKSSDVAHGVSTPRRAVVVTQRQLGEDTMRLREFAPATWSYLMGHREALDARKSSIYRSQPPFAIFGVGPYSFAPWKVAISGLYKRLTFSLVGPCDGQPVLFDDTCYFLPFEREDDARRAHEALQGDDVQAFFHAQVFWDAKRPIHKALLQSLDLRRVLHDRDRSSRAEVRGPVGQLALFR